MRYPESEQIERLQHDYAELVGQYEDLTQNYEEACTQKAGLCKTAVEATNVAKELLASMSQGSMTSGTIKTGLQMIIKLLEEV